MSVEEPRDEALRLNREARAYLARELLASLDAMEEAETEELWIDEAIRRDDALSSDAACAYPADQVLARAQASRK